MSKEKKTKPEQEQPEAAEIESVEQEQTEAAEVEPVELEVLKDDPTMVALTILVVCTEPTGELLRYALRSLANIRGVEALVKVTGTNKPTWLPHEDFIAVEGKTEKEIIREALTDIPSERVIIMTDHMIISTPVTLADIAINKALPEPPNKVVIDVLADMYGYRSRVENYDTHTPLYAFTSEVSKVMSSNFPAVVDFRQIYCNLIYQDVRPMLLNWRNDPWVLPIVSSRPSPSVAINYARKKKFLWVKECNEFICNEILEKLFPTPTMPKVNEDQQ